jgi:elongation factor P--beta-lysine ligase
MDVLAARHKIKRALRDYFDAEGFLEIDMPLLVRGTTPDAEVPSFRVEDRYLVTSCEYQIKRMEIGGFDKLYTLTQNFRAKDHGAYRNPEFTMLEWARVGAALTDIETDVENFIRAAWQALHGDKPFVYQGRKIDLSGAWQRQTVRDALTQHSGIIVGDFSAETLYATATALKLHIAEHQMNDANFLFSAVFEEIQPKLGFDRPVFITAWPQHMTASADIDGSGDFSTRSELFIAGVELSDGFPSLTDTHRQQQSFAEQQAQREKRGYETVAVDEKFLNALQEGLPKGAGMALGFDRLVMLLTNQTALKPTLAFDWDEL